MRKRQVRQTVHRMPKIYATPTTPKHSGKFLSLLKNAVVLGLLGLAAYGFYFGPWLRVRMVEVKGVQFTNETDIRQQVPVGVHLWALPRAQIERSILQVPTVQAVSVLRGIPDSVRVVIEERKPSLIWISSGIAHVLDENGTEYARYPENSLPASGTPVGDLVTSVPRVYDIQNIQVTSGQKVVSPLFISFIKQAQKDSAALLPERKLERFEVDSSIFDIQLVYAGGMRVDTNVLTDPSVQVRNLKRLLQENTVNPASRIDLRIDRWAYVE